LRDARLDQVISLASDDAVRAAAAQNHIAAARQTVALDRVRVIRADRGYDRLRIGQSEYRGPIHDLAGLRQIEIDGTTELMEVQRVEICRMDIVDGVIAQLIADEEIHVMAAIAGQCVIPGAEIELVVSA